AKEVAGAQYVQQSMYMVMGDFGPYFVSVIMVLFAFTTLLGNLFYVDNALAYINGKKMPGKSFMSSFRVVCAIVVLVGAIMPMADAWAIADILMGVMALINIPCIMVGGSLVIKALADYEKQKREGKNPEFHASSIGLDPEKLDYWK
ncbi:MAG: alanine:cation symporter family protein, partial [Synergistaceae bacterium]|nr:alanine:cation symporter family protein [Synergistaceae bacterium]